MNRIFRYAFWKIKGIQVFALVGDSGTGKSFRSKVIADKHNIELIIDDGLLIRGDKILAGKSAKQESNFLKAVKTALFDDDDHQREVYNALQREKYHKILIIGTSEKMVYKIANRLKLLEPEKVFRIEDFASPQEIEKAKKIRFTEGKHVIPVPSIEITRNYPQIVYDSLRVFIKGKRGQNLFNKKKKSYEKTIVRPSFSKVDKTEFTEAATTSMVRHCLDSFDNHIKVNKVESVKDNQDSYALHVILDIPRYHQFPFNKTTGDLEDYIKRSLFDYAGMHIKSASVEISENY